MLRPSIGIDWDDVTAPFNSVPSVWQLKISSGEALPPGRDHFLGQ